mmetsp:Transcript_12640/g.16599  ORF Transcript_12640/g.16599 Transcript_12640/m.16599 type:complete len:95 (+) Transcript_12640:149-433(+)
MDSKAYDLEQVANQTGTAIIKIDDGGILKTTGDLSSEEGGKVLSSLRQIVMDTGAVLQQDPLQRISVMYSSYQYVITLSDSKIYIVKKLNEADC